MMSGCDNVVSSEWWCAGCKSAERRAVKKYGIEGSVAPTNAEVVGKTGRVTVSEPAPAPAPPPSPEDGVDDGDNLDAADFDIELDTAICPF